MTCGGGGGASNAYALIELTDVVEKGLRSASLRDRAGSTHKTNLLRRGRRREGYVKQDACSYWCQV